MPSFQTQTDFVSAPLNGEDRARWFAGLRDSSGVLNSSQIGFGSLSTQNEYDLVDERDVDNSLTEEDDFVVVLSKTNAPLRIREASNSGIRVLTHRGAFSTLR